MGTGPEGADESGLSSADIYLPTVAEDGTRDLVSECRRMGDEDGYQRVQR